ncbi:hypothetical protein [Devosia sp. CAU 1758]
MIIFGPLTRAAALAGLLFTAALGAAPVAAAPADVALLKSYIGDWVGNGVLIGADTETVRCRLSLTQGNQDKVNYNGRCAFAGSPPLSVSGTMAHVEASKRFEAVMEFNSFSGVAVGQKRGSGLVFNLRERDQDEEGKELSISAQIQLNQGAIQVQFELVYIESGDSLRAEIPFAR